MSREELFIGLRWLCQQLYAPENFARRVLQMVDSLRPAPGAAELCGAAPLRPIESEALLLIEQLLRRGPEERKMCAAVFRAMQAKPLTGKLVMAALYRYAQIRCMYETAGFLPATPESFPKPLNSGFLPARDDSRGAGAFARAGPPAPTIQSSMP
jgi:hypothetical protein